MLTWELFKPGALLVVLGHGRFKTRTLLGGSWDLVSRVISTLIRVISRYYYSCPPREPNTP